MRNKCVAEALGAFTLCFIGILAITGSSIVGATGITNLASIALAHGLAIGLMVAALGAVSGAHFNPAVTFAFVVSRRMDVKTGLAYWGSQLVGGLIAGLLIVAMFSQHVVASGTPDVGPHVGIGAAIVIEAITTFFLVTVIFGTAVDERAPKNIYPFAIGLTIAMDIMAAGPLTGAAMNPARWLGPAIASGHFAHAIVYWVGPLAGGALAAAVYEWFVRARAAVAAETEVTELQPVELPKAA